MYTNSASKFQNQHSKLVTEWSLNRLYVSSLNGLAGLDIIEEKYVEAAEKYREVLRIVSEYKGKVKTDTLQQLHTGDYFLVLILLKTS